MESQMESATELEFIPEENRSGIVSRAYSFAKSKATPYKSYIYTFLAAYAILGVTIGAVLYAKQPAEIQNYKTMSRMSYAYNMKKRDLPINCTSSSECGNGQCVKSDSIDSEFVCECDDFYINRKGGVCNYKMRPKLNAFLASFFGGWVGADWFYLYNGGHGKYIVAGVFKLITLGMCGIWEFVDWIRILCDAFPDGHGVVPTQW